MRTVHGEDAGAAAFRCPFHLQCTIGIDRFHFASTRLTLEAKLLRLAATDEVCIVIQRCILCVNGVQHMLRQVRFDVCHRQWSSREFTQSTAAWFFRVRRVYVHANPDQKAVPCGATPRVFDKDSGAFQPLAIFVLDQDVIGPFDPYSAHPRGITEQAGDGTANARGHGSVEHHWVSL